MCILKIISNTESFKVFASNNPDIVFRVRERGEVRRKSTGELFPSFMLSLKASDKDWDDLKGQIDDAIDFLDENFNTLKRLLETHDVEDSFLDFPVESRLNDEIGNQNDYLPRELIKLAGKLDLAIVISNYL